MGWETEHTRGPGCLFQVGVASEILICSVPAQSPKRKEAWGYCWHGTKLFPWRSRRFKALKHSGYKHKLGVGVGGGKCCCWAVAHQPNPSTSPSLSFLTLPAVCAWKKTGEVSRGTVPNAQPKVACPPPLPPDFWRVSDLTYKAVTALLPQARCYLQQRRKIFLSYPSSWLKDDNPHMWENWNTTLFL